MEEIELQSVILVRHFELLRRRSDTHALDRAGYLVPRILERAGPTDIRGLTAALGPDPSAAGRQARAMESGGLVRRAL